jgi:hypothetical protein
MPLWVKWMLLGMGVAFMAVGTFVGVVSARQERAEVARLEQLPSLSAATLEDQPGGTEAFVEGVVSPDNRVVFRDFVAYVREELDVTTDSDGDRDETWRSDGGETPGLLLEVGGVVRVGKGYGIARGHHVWYDEATLGFNRRPRDGSERYHGLVAGGRVTAVGNVVDGPEGKELDARTLFGGTRDEYLTSRRGVAASMRILGGLFGVVGLLLAAVGMLLSLPRDWCRFSRG